MSDAWQTVQEATDGAAAVADAISGVFEDISGVIENAGVMGSVNGLLSALRRSKAGDSDGQCASFTGRKPSGGILRAV
jgi:hypothetical protein